MGRFGKVNLAAPCQPERRKILKIIVDNGTHVGGAR